MSTIRLESVSHSYDGTPVLRDISVTLSERRIGVVGANGSGKSTLARMINGLVHPTAGTVTVDGIDVKAHGRAVRRKVGFIFTDADTQIVMPTVGEDVAFSLRKSGLSPDEITARVATMLASMQLSPFADHPAHLLSGGQKQMLALAAVLVREPEIIVADEPTTLLDRRNTRRIGAILAALPQQLIVVTHQLELLTGFDRVIVIDQGRIVADGEPQRSLSIYRALCDVDDETPVSP